MRKPFVSPTASASGGGAPTPGMGMPPTPTMAGPQPTMPMGGSPGAAMQGPGGAGGGPTSPFNIQSMLQTQQPPQTMGQAGPMAPQPSPMTVGQPLPPWGDQGVSGAGGMQNQGPKRVPIDLSGANGGGGSDYGMGQTAAGGADAQGMDLGGDQSGGPTVMMRLLRSLGKI